MVHCGSPFIFLAIGLGALCIFKNVACEKDETGTEEKTEEQEIPPSAKKTKKVIPDAVKSYNAILAAGSEVGWSSYIGCYKLAPNHTETEITKAGIKSQMIVETCIGHCWFMRKTFALLKHGQYCRCMNVLVGLVRAKEDWCRTPCKNKKEQVCGGKHSFVVYYTGYIEEPLFTQITLHGTKKAFDGCFQDRGYKILCPYHIESVRMKVAMCLSLCEDKMFQLAALDNPERCCCADTRKGTHHARKMSCQRQCQGDSKELSCGGAAGFLSVYRTGVTEILGKRKPPHPPNALWLRPHINESSIKMQ